MSDTTPTHGELVAGVVRSAHAEFSNEAAILNKDSSDWIYARADGRDPAVDADGSYAIPPGSQRVLILEGTDVRDREVRMISTGNPGYEVEFG